VKRREIPPERLDKNLGMYTTERLGRDWAVQREFDKLHQDYYPKGEEPKVRRVPRKRKVEPESENESDSESDHESESGSDSERDEDSDE